MARQQILAARQDPADAAARCGRVLAAAGFGGTVLLFLISGRHLMRSARRVTDTPSHVVSGDLSERVPQESPVLVGGLERFCTTTAAAAEISQDELRRTAADQAALLRVATLVARGMSPTALFSVVAAECGEVLGAETTALVRFEPDRSATVAGTWEKPGKNGIALPLGSRWPAEDGSVEARVQRAGAPARVSNYEREVGAKHDWATAHGIVSSVGSPIVVDGDLWGALIAFSGTSAADPDGTEDHLLAFSELVAMAIANTESRSRLEASRARVVAAADAARRGIERDLHGRTQQRLISLALELRAAESRVPPELGGQVEQWSRTAQGLADAAADLRKISEGLYPAILDKGGLVPAVRAATRRVRFPVKLSMEVRERLPQDVELAAYNVVSEALANAVKHAQASVIEVDVGVVADDLRLHVRDDGIGGADMARGLGLTGLSDRIEAVGGRMEIVSPAGGGTSVLVTIPLTSS